MISASHKLALIQSDVQIKGRAVIEAMKMQNLLKSERDSKIKSVKVVAGDSVAADQLLIEFVYIFLLKLKLITTFWVF